MKFKALLFDCDGTVIDSNQQIMNSWRTATNFFLPGKPVTDYDIKKYFGRSFEGAAELLAKEFGAENYNLEEIAKVYWGYHESHPEDIKGVFPGVAEALRALKAKGVKLGIVTSGLNASCAKELELFGIGDVFDTIVGADDVREPKPSPQPAVVGCQRLGLDPKKVLLIGDSRNDIACGNKAGCTTALVSWTMCNMEQLADVEKPDIMVNDAMQLLEYV